MRLWVISFLWTVSVLRRAKARLSFTAQLSGSWPDFNRFLQWFSVFSLLELPLIHWLRGQRGPCSESLHPAVTAHTHNSWFKEKGKEEGEEKCDSMHYILSLLYATICIFWACHTFFISRGSSSNHWPDSLLIHPFSDSCCLFWRTSSWHGRRCFMESIYRALDFLKTAPTG